MEEELAAGTAGRPGQGDSCLGFAFDLELDGMEALIQYIASCPSPSDPRNSTMHPSLLVPPMRKVVYCSHIAT